MTANRLRFPGLVLLLAALLLSPQSGRGTAAQQAGDAADDAAGLLVYHQITDLSEESVGVGYPVLSADGSTAVFADAPGSGDPATPNRIFVVGTQGGEPTQVDAYQTLCFCASLVDISDDGETVVSTDSVQVRIAEGGDASELIALYSNEITAVRISGDGRTVFFLVRRDTSTRDGATTLERGIWAIDADGDDLRLVAGAADVAEAVGLTIAETGCCFHADGSPLAVSADGDRVAFGAFAGTGEYLFAVDGDGGTPRQLLGPASWVPGVAISDDGGTVGYTAIFPDRHGGANEVGVVAAGGGEARPLAIGTATGFDQPLSLSADGSQLLIAPDGLLIDTESGETRQLGVLTPGADSHTALLTDWLDRATMNADATRVLYAFRTIRCADCPNLPEELATLEIDPDDLGAAPAILEASIEPAAIPLNRQQAATASAEVEADGTLVAVGLVALRDGRYDVNVGYGALLHDDGQNADEVASDGVFTNAEIVHAAYETREDDTGPRVLRVQAEVEAADGLHHATAVEVGPLTVVGGE